MGRRPLEVSERGSSQAFLFEKFLPQACTFFHRVFLRLLLPTFESALSMRSRLIGKKNFTSQFRDNGKGKTEPAFTGLSWEENFTRQFRDDSVGKTKLALKELD